MGMIKTARVVLFIISWLMGVAPLWAREDMSPFSLEPLTHFNKSTFQIPAHLDRVGSFYTIDPIHEVFFAYNVMQSERMGVMTLGLVDQFFSKESALKSTIDKECSQQHCFITALRQINVEYVMELYVRYQVQKDVFVKELTGHLLQVFKGTGCIWGQDMTSCLKEVGKIVTIFHMSVETHLISPGFQSSPPNLPHQFKELQAIYGEIFVGFYKLLESQFVNSCEENSFFHDVVANLAWITEGLWVRALPSGKVFNIIMQTSEELGTPTKKVLSIYLNTVNYGQGHHFFFRADKFLVEAERTWSEDPLSPEQSAEWATSLNIMLNPNGTCPLVRAEKDCTFDFFPYR